MPAARQAPTMETLKMPTPTTFSLRAALIFALCSPVLALAAPPDLPKRKSGLWEIEVQHNGRPMPMGPMRQCIDEKTDDIMKQEAQSADIDCSQRDWRRDGDRVTIKSVCKIMGSTATTEGFFAGDFTANYRGEMRTVFDPPMHGAGASTMIVSAKWTGPCAAGQKAGDIVMPGAAGGATGGPGGQTLNVEELMKMRDKMKQMRAPGQ
jgi:hypothetical protein